MTGKRVWYLHFIWLARFAHFKVQFATARCRAYKNAWNLRPIRWVLRCVSKFCGAKNMITHKLRGFRTILIEYASSPSPSVWIVNNSRRNIQVNNSQYPTSFLWILKPSFSLYRLKAARLDLRTWSWIYSILYESIMAFSGGNLDQCFGPNQMA